MSDLAKGKLGTVGDYDVVFSGGKLSISVAAGADGLSAGMNVGVDARVVVDALFKLLPQGTITHEINAAIDAAIALT